ncbi:MAG: hypothetical protein MUC71_03145 [Steroidobacteraceae bacterium]|nr:hypothetical protein [Steroidobacteraceae bacterium]
MVTFNCTAVWHRDGKNIGEKVSLDNNLRCSMPALLGRSRKVRFGRIARKPAPMLMLRTLTVKMTVKVCGAAESALRINSLEGSLMIEWE